VTEQSWPLSVREPNGRTRRGVVAYARSPHAEPEAGAAAEFRIVLLTRAARPKLPADATALCVPAGPARVFAGFTPPSRLSSLRLSEEQMAAYRGGSIIAAMPIEVAPADVFRAGCERPDLQRLASALIAALDAELVAAYVGTLRHALGLESGADPLDELAVRLSPPEAPERPPRRAPGIARLHRALERLRRHEAPGVSIDQFAEDLRLLRMFARDDAWPRDAMQRLLTDVQPRARAGVRIRAGRVVPIGRRRPR